MTGKRKIRAEFRKEHQGRRRQKDLTRGLAREDLTEDDLVKSERLSGKGDLTRKRTIIGQEADDAASGLAVVRDVAAEGICGRVLAVHGLASVVWTDDGRSFQCATRRLLKNLSTDQRHVVAAGDVVYFRPESATTGLIERVEPRTSVLGRTSKRRQHVLG